MLALQVTESGQSAPLARSSAPRTRLEVSEGCCFLMELANTPGL